MGCRGQSDAALRYAEAALVRDPLDYSNYNRVADIQMFAGRYALAEAAYRKSYGLNPAQNRLHETLGTLRFAIGDEASRRPAIQSAVA